MTYFCIRGTFGQSSWFQMGIISCHQYVDCSVNVKILDRAHQDFADANRLCRAKKGASQGVKAPVVTFRDVAGVDSVKVSHLTSMSSLGFHG